MARTHRDHKVYICTTPQPSDLNVGQYEGLDYVEVKNVGAVGEMGTTTNIVSYDELSTDVTQKAKGISNAGDPTIECSRNPTDPGQVALRAAAKTNFVYAFKFVANDAPSADYTNTVIYTRGVVAGPTRPRGRNEDFDLEVFTIGALQLEIVVDPEPLVVPSVSQLPSIIGAEVKQGVALTGLPGSYTNGPVTYAFQWQHDDAGDLSFADVDGATSAAYTPAAGVVGDSLRLKVTPSNAAGAGDPAYSLPTAVVAAE